MDLNKVDADLVETDYESRGEKEQFLLKIFMKQKQ